MPTTKYMILRVKKSKRLIVGVIYGDRPKDLYIQGSKRGLSGPFELNDARFEQVDT